MQKDHEEQEAWEVEREDAVSASHRLDLSGPPEARWVMHYQFSDAIRGK